ncbi:MAG TPA: hypothetical protein VKA82_02440, partial [Rubrobacter sp.]|nr:hypothetical protein [Rubrobacter sp.]
DLHAFHDTARVMGTLSHDLGKAHELAGPAPHNSTVLFHLLTQAPDDPSPEGVTVESLREAGERISSVIEPLEGARMDREDAGITRDEFANAARMMLHACERGRRCSMEPSTPPKNVMSWPPRCVPSWVSTAACGALATALAACKTARVSSSSGCRSTRELREV